MSTLKKNLVYNFLLSLSQVLLPVISIPYLSRVLDAEGIGRVSFIDSFTYYFVSIAEFGITVYGMREVAKARHNKELLDKLVSELIFLHFLATCISLLFYFATIYFVWEEIADVRLLVFSVTFLLVNAFACEWYFLGMERFRFITFRSILTRLAGITTIFIFIHKSSDFYIYYGVMTGAACVNLIWNNAALIQEVKLSWINLDWQRHVRFTWVTYLISLIYGITLLLDNVILGLVSIPAAVGYYAFAMRLSKTASQLLTDALLVFFSRTVLFVQQADIHGLQKTILRTVQLIIIFAIPVSAGLFLLADEIVLLFLGQGFAPAIVDLRILSLLPALRGYNIFLSKQILLPYNKERQYLKALSAGGVVFFMSSLVLSTEFADQGTCYAILIAEIVTIIMNRSYAKKTNSDLQMFDWRSTGHAIVTALLFIPIVYGVRKFSDSLLLTILLSTTACALVYFIVLTFALRNEFTLIVKKDFTRLVKERFS